MNKVISNQRENVDLSYGDTLVSKLLREDVHMRPAHL